MTPAVVKKKNDPRSPTCTTRLLGFKDDRSQQGQSRSTEFAIRVGREAQVQEVVVLFCYNLARPHAGALRCSVASPMGLHVLAAHDWELSA